MNDETDAQLYAAHAADVPLFVRQADDGYAVVRTTDGAILATHTRVRDALDAILESSLAVAVKAPNLRTDGEPDGAWRWIDATAEEEDAKGGIRVDAAAIWSMAARLNARASAVPVDGGGSPGAGYAPSVAHGTARDPATPANGYAHAGVPVEGSERTHLFLRAELLPEIAREVDRGRLAYSSVHFRWDGEPDESGRVEGATLASLAILNDPAITTLSPGSERQAVRVHQRVLAERKIMTTKNTGPSATRSADAVEGAPDAARAVDGLQGPDADAALAAMLNLGREILGKPEAAPAEVLAELAASKEALAAALAKKPTPEEGMPSEGAPVEMPPAKTDEDEDASKQAAVSLSAADRAELESLRAHKRLRAECATRGVTLPAEKADRWATIAVKSGWDVVTELLDQEKSAQPPAGPSVMGPPSAVRSAGVGAGDAPKSVASAMRAVMGEAREALAKRGHKNPPQSFVLSEAQRIGAQRWPSLDWGVKAVTKSNSATRVAGPSV